MAIPLQGKEFIPQHNFSSGLCIKADMMVELPDSGGQVDHMVEEEASSLNLDWDLAVLPFRC